MNFIFRGISDDNDNIIHTGAEQITFVRSFQTWEAYVAVAETAELAPITSRAADDRRVWLLANYKFYELSSVMQVWVISRSNFFSGNAMYREWGLFSMEYGGISGNTRGQSDVMQMRIMAANEAIGSCDDFARYEVTVFTQLGIEAVYESDPGHAWTMVYPYNADGQKLKYMFDYGIKDSTVAKAKNCNSPNLIY